MNTASSSQTLEQLLTQLGPRPATPSESELVAEIHRLDLQLSEAKSALASVIANVITVYAESESRAFSPEQWRDMVKAMDSAHAVLNPPKLP